MTELTLFDGARILLIDGATGTELDRRGVDTSLPLWSARALLEAPDALRRVHEAYLDAGADIITANTFRTHRRTLTKADMGDRAEALTHEAVAIARAARDRCNPGAIIAGSIAPLEDCYRPDLSPDESTCRREHAELIEHLLDAGADLILIETMNALTEAKAAAEAARQLAPDRWMISFCMRADGPPGRLLSDEPVDSLLPTLAGAKAVGVNCVGAPATVAHVAHLRGVVPDQVRIAAYANIGVADDDGSWICTDAIAPTRYAAYAREWIDAGATIVGGCCGTTPATIAAIDREIRTPSFG